MILSGDNLYTRPTTQRKFGSKRSLGACVLVVDAEKLEKVVCATFYRSSSLAYPEQEGRPVSWKSFKER